MKRLILRSGAAAVALGLLCAAGAAVFLHSWSLTPRALAPYIEKRSSGHRPLITDTGSWVGATLRTLDRGAAPTALPPLKVGAQPQAAGSGAGQLKPVASAEEARRAFAEALSGDVITFAPGVYRFDQPLYASRPGVAGVPVTVRAERPGTVTLEFSAQEGFVVRAPYWRFENLVLRGICSTDTRCEHAFHVVGGGDHFAAVNNTLLDFNAHFKINGSGGRFPDHGLIAENTLSNSRPRDTASPVTPIDLVAASDWTIRGNLISDFIKGGGDRVSYGAFAKGAGERNVFERNVVWCEQRLRGHKGQRIGLSLGGGATGKPYCRDRQCIAEQHQGVIRDNLIASCSDVGIYLNNAAASEIAHNTVVDTAGIDVRFPASSADLAGNLVEGPIRSRNDGLVRLGDNHVTSLLWSYVGHHPVRSLFSDWEAGDLAWNGAPPRRDVSVPRVDLCGKPRAAQAAYGAFEDFGACLAGAPPSAATSSSSAAN